MNQIPLSFESHDSFDASDYVVNQSNQQMFDAVMQPSVWGAYGMLLSGAPASGKTHLAHIWSNRFSAVMADASMVARLLEDDSFPQYCAIDNVDSSGISQTHLFHLLNRAREVSSHILLTTTRNPAQWASLPDLLSRLNALAYAEIPQPDEEMLFSVIRKQLADRQLRVEEDAIQYLISRSERSFLIIQNTIKTLDLSSLIRKQGVTIPLIRRVLENVQQENP